jgi:hypothetical protein
MQLHIILLFSLLCFTNAIQHNSYFKLRNTVLRLILFKNNNTILIKKKFKEIYDLSIVKINKLNIEYYKIPEDDRYMIEMIIGLNF